MPLKSFYIAIMRVDPLLFLVLSVAPLLLLLLSVAPLFLLVLLCYGGSFSAVFSYKGVRISRHVYLIHSHNDKLVFVFSAGLVVYLNRVCEMPHND